MDRIKRKVAVIGALNVDIGAHPEGPLLAGDSIPGRVRSSLGGVGWNVARNCALLGADTAFFSLLGRDEHETAIRAEGRRFGLDLSGCQWTDEANNRYLYICDEAGDVAAAVNDMRLCERMDAGFAAACVPLADRSGAVVVDANLPAGTLAYLAEHVTAPLAADGVSTAKCGRLKAILPRLGMLKLNGLEAAALTGREDPEQSADALLRAGVERVVISLGEQGVLCGQGRRLFYLRAPAVEVVDATGAGDSLMAALAVGLSAGLDLKDCAEMGVAAAAITLAHPGSVTEALRALAR